MGDFGRKFCVGADKWNSKKKCFLSNTKQPSNKLLFYNLKSYVLCILMNHQNVIRNKTRKRAATNIDNRKEDNIGNEMIIVIARSISF